jgi:hypothetical protein
MEKGIRMSKDKITHKTHGIKGHYLSGHDNIKNNKSDEKANGQHKAKHETHRTKEHIRGCPDNVKHMIHRMGESIPNRLEQIKQGTFNKRTHPE